MHTTVIHFFDESQIGMIRGDTSFATLPSITVPPVKMFKDGFSDLLATDEKFKVSLVKSVAAIKKDEELIRDLPDAILNDKTLIFDPFDIWPTYVTIGVGVLCILLIVRSIWLMVKLRAVALAVAV